MAMTRKSQEPCDIAVLIGAVSGVTETAWPKTYDDAYTGKTR